MKNDLTLSDIIFYALAAATVAGILGICAYAIVRNYELEEKRLALPQPAAQVVRIEYGPAGAKP